MNRPLPRRISTQILLAVLLPVAVVTTVLTGYYASARYQDLEADERRLGEVAIGYLAQRVELPLFAGNQQTLEELAGNLLRRPGIESIVFFDETGTAIVRQGQALALPQRQDLPRVSVSTQTAGDLLVFTQPVRVLPMEVEDFDPAAMPDSARRGEIIGWVEMGLSRTRTVDRINRMLLVASLLAFGAFLVGVLVARRADATIARPVQDLTRHLRQLDGPEAQYHFSPRGSRELLFLAQGINELVDRIRLQLERQTQEIEAATTRLSQRNRQLEETRQVLEQALQSKDDFLARVSHELRTPLTTIMGFNRLIPGNDNQEQVAEYSGHIGHASTLLHSIIDDILDYSRLQSANFELEHLPFDLEECMENVVGMHGYEALAKQLELVLLLDSEVPHHCLGDSQRLQQVVNNLVSNALKFTTRGEVIIRVTLLQRESDHATLQCEIRDTGIGIHAQEQERLFQPFTQADNSITRKYGGSGLGLAISRSLVEQMGGEINLHSEQGQGTKVTFTFNVGVNTDIDEAGVGQARVPVLAYDSNDWSRRALREGLLQWSLSIAVCQDRTSFIARLGEAETSTLVVLSLSHLEAQPEAFADFARQIRRLFQGPLVVLSPIPDMEEQVRSRGVDTANMGFTLKPLRRRQLVERCDQLINPGARQPVAEAPGHSLAGLHILVAEDHTLIRELLARNLREAGATVEAVTDGEQAVLATQGKDFDLILLDLHMPRMDGADAIINIRAQGGAMPIICLTADITAQERQALSDSGVDAVLLKPINEPELLQTVRRHCGLGPAQPEEDARSRSDDKGTSTPKLRDSLLSLLDATEAAYNAGDEARYQQGLHDLLGVAGMYEKRLLEEMIRAMKLQGFGLDTSEAHHLFAEARTLIHKY